MQDYSDSHNLTQVTKKREKVRGGSNKSKAEALRKANADLHSVTGLQPERTDEEETARMLEEAYLAIPERAGPRGNKRAWRMRNKHWNKRRQDNIQKIQGIA